MENEMPVYVRIEDYKEVLDLVHSLKVKLEEAKTTLDQITQLKNDEDAELESWKVGLQDMEQKVELIDKSLFEPHRL